MPEQLPNKGVFLWKKFLKDNNTNVTLTARNTYYVFWKLVINYVQPNYLSTKDYKNGEENTG